MGKTKEVAIVTIEKLVSNPSSLGLVPPSLNYVSA